MKYSVHNPFVGGFDYYESADTVQLNDDHATPRLESLKTPLGVPATLAGRPLPPGSRKVGHGPFPVGSISSGQVGVWSGTRARGGVPSGIGAYVFGPCDEVQGTAFAVGCAVGVALYLASKRYGVAAGVLDVVVPGAAVGFLAVFAARKACT